jgi:threonine aldolase
MNFCSDNVTGASAEVLAALARANEGPAMPYGDDPLTADVVERLQELFEAEAEVFLVATGSTANSLALAAMTPPYGAIYCHPESHVNTDECGAPEFFTGGAKLVPVAGEHGKIAARDLEATVAKGGAGVVHHVQPAAVSITQLTESGTIYTLEETAAIAEVCRGHGLKLHMDGARFANALVTLGCSPAEATWQAGVDALSFGATKNGALAAEAILFFDRDLAVDAGYRRKRAGHLWSKMRFIAAQFDGYLADDLWLRNARHANAMAAKLAHGLVAIPGAGLMHPVEGNEIFATLPAGATDGLEADGFKFYPWGLSESRGGSVGAGGVRLVTAFNTLEADVDAFVASAARHGQAAAE